MTDTNMNRRQFMQLVGIAALTQPRASMASGSAAVRGRKPNVIVIMTDDQGYGDISCHGNPFVKTPQLDRLWRESVRFTDFHVDPTCSPTRAALMTGRYSSRTGVWLTYAGRHHLRRDEVTMADVFSNNDYRTAIFGKWHLGDNYPFRPNDRGFDESLIHGGGVVGEAPDYWGNDYYDDVYMRNGRPERVRGYCTDVWFNEAMRFIGENRDRPFFLYLATNAPHGPHHVPAEYADPYRDRPDIPQSRALFYGMIANIDENIGRLRRSLDELNLAEDTVLVFLTDNGTAGGVNFRRKGKVDKNGPPVDGYNAAMRGKKGTAYEGGHRAACFIHWPGGLMNCGRDIEPLTAHIDLLPTLIDLCRLKPPEEVAFDGRSLAPLIHENKRAWPQRTLFVHHQGRFGQPLGEGLPINYKDFAVMTNRWRLVGKELYDIDADPGQGRDIARQHPGVVSRLQRAYESWWTDISEHFDEYCPFVIDPAQQYTVLLTGQSWHGDTIPYNQHHIRSALKSNGYWVLDVAKSGDYRIELRRWPRELNKTIGDTHDHTEHDPARYDVKNNLLQLPSRTIRAETARLQIGDFDQTRPVGTGDRAVTFHVRLKGGRQRLKSSFTTVGGDEYSAYYVYVEPA